MIYVKIGDKDYFVEEAKTESEKEQGLQGVHSLPEDSGMLFYFDDPQTVSMWMRNTLIPLDIIFINSENKVSKVHQGIPEDDTLVTQDNTKYVLEVNANSEVKVGDIFSIVEDGPVMKVLAQDGTSQMDLWGGERIFSRKNTIILIKKAKKAAETKDDKDIKALGRYMFKCIKGQDERPAEYVNTPK